MRRQEIDENESFSPVDSERRRPIYYLVLIMICFVLAVGLLIAGPVLYVYGRENAPFDYALLIDAGSTHTHTFLYKWLATKNIKQIDDCNFKGGVAKLENPTTIAQCVNNVTVNLPVDIKRHTPLYLGATAGMRLLNLSNPKASDLVLLSLKCSLKETKVSVKNVDIISGEDEGKYAWIAVNYLAGKLTIDDVKKKQLTIGALDMGGASTQIAYGINASMPETSENTTSVTLFRHSYDVVSRSFLCFGVEEANNRHQALLVNNVSETEVDDPCLPKDARIMSSGEKLFGQPCTSSHKFRSWFFQLEETNQTMKLFTFKGTGNYEQCQNSLAALTTEKECTEAGFEECPQQFEIPFRDRKYVAFSSYYYTAKFLNATGTLPNFMEKTINWCRLPWHTIKEMFPKVKFGYLRKYCFNAVFITNWLTKIYNLDENTWSNLIFLKKMNGTNIGWALGYVYSTNAEKQDRSSDNGISPTALGLFLLGSLLLIAVGTLFAQKYFCKVPDYKRLLYQNF